MLGTVLKGWAFSCSLAVKTLLKFLMNILWEQDFSGHIQLKKSQLCTETCADCTIKKCLTILNSNVPFRTYKFWSSTEFTSESMIGLSTTGAHCTNRKDTYKYSMKHKIIKSNPGKQHLDGAILAWYWLNGGVPSFPSQTKAAVPLPARLQPYPGCFLMVPCCLLFCHHTCTFISMTVPLSIGSLVLLINSAGVFIVLFPRLEAADRYRGS